MKKLFHAGTAAFALLVTPALTVELRALLSATGPGPQHAAYDVELDYFFLGRMLWHVDAKPSQARERGGYGFLVFRLHEMQLNPEAVGVGLVDFGFGTLQ